MAMTTIASIKVKARRWACRLGIPHLRFPDSVAALSQPEGAGGTSGSITVLNIKEAEEACQHFGVVQCDNFSYPPTQQLTDYNKLSLPSRLRQDVVSIDSNKIASSQSLVTMREAQIVVSFPWLSR